VPADRWLDVVAGFIVVNDVSARDWQNHSPTFTMGKSFDTHGPPAVDRHPDEIGDPAPCACGPGSTASYARTPPPPT